MNRKILSIAIAIAIAVVLLGNGVASANEKSEYIGKWVNKNTQDEITIKNAESIDEYSFKWIVVTSKGDSREAEKIIKFTNDGNQSKTLFDVDGCKIRISISNDKIEAVLNSAASGQ